MPEDDWPDLSLYEYEEMSWKELESLRSVAGV
jgi:hypothetical protein